MTDEQICAVFNLNILPQHMRGGILRYLQSGIGPGSFASAILENKFAEAHGRADEINTERLRDWANWLYNYAPSDCWGSAEKVKKWKAHSGLSGLEEKKE
jgi:hypothetical protein